MKMAVSNIGIGLHNASEAHGLSRLLSELQIAQFPEVAWDVKVHLNVLKASHTFALVRANEVVFSTTDPAEMALRMQAIIALEGE